MRYLFPAVLVICLVAVACDNGSGTSLEEGAPPPLYRGDRPNTTVIALHSSPSRHWATPAIGVSENHYHLLAYDGVDAGNEYGPRRQPWTSSCRRRRQPSTTSCELPFWSSEARAGARKRPGPNSFGFRRRFD